MSVAREIGRINVPLLPRLGDTDLAVVATITVNAIPIPVAGIRFAGLSRFTEPVAVHIENLLLPLVSDITSRLGLPPHRLEITIGNLGPASSRNQGLSVAEYSADLALFLAMLSAALRIPVPQNVAVTGHLASQYGDVTAVAGLEKKLAAATAAPDIEGFLYPSLDHDHGTQQWTPKTAERWAYAMAQASSELDLHAVRDVADAVTRLLDETGVVHAALAGGYWDHQREHEVHRSPLDRILAHLTGNLEERFWHLLERAVFDGDNGRVSSLLYTYAAFHRDQNQYPEDFGGRFDALLRALPPYRGRRELVYPLIPAHLLNDLGSFATGEAQGDWEILRCAASERPYTGSPAAAAMPQESAYTTDELATLLDDLTEQLSEAAIQEEVYRPIDEARATFGPHNAVARDIEGFEETISAFYLHLVRHTKSLLRVSDAEEIAAQANSLLQRAYERQGGDEAAVAQGLNPAAGGLRNVLERLTEQAKWEARTQHENRMLKEALEPLDWPGRLGLATLLHERICRYAGMDTKEVDPKEWAGDLERYIRRYVDSLNHAELRLRGF